MNGFVIVNPEVLIARELERGGRHAPGLDFIRWRLADIRRETIDDAEFWGIHRHDIARQRAAQLAELRLANNLRSLHSSNLNDAANLSESNRETYGSVRIWRL